MEKTKKVIWGIIGVCVVILILSVVLFFMRASTQRTLKDIESEYTGGLNRIVNVYSYDGKKIATYDGRIDIANHNDGTVKFQIKGKRYIYYNALVEVIEK